jgi:hypothetical protein
VPSPEFNALPPHVKAMVQLLSEGLTQYFVQHFPTGIADPNIPIIVKRDTANGPIMQQTSFAQLMAEHIDESKRLRKSLHELSDLTAEALEETTPQRRRRKRD